MSESDEVRERSPFASPWVIASGLIVIIVVAMDRQSNRVVSGPDIVSRGFVYVRESEALMDEARARVQQALDRCEDENVREWSAIKSNVRDALSRYLFDKTRRRPMILPIIIEV